MSLLQLVSKLMLFAGVITLIHAGFSAREYKLALKSGLSSNGILQIPFDIVIESLVGMVLAIVGSIFAVESFSKISMEAELNKYTVEGVFSSPSFLSFNHRTRQLQTPR